MAEQFTFTSHHNTPVPDSDTEMIMTLEFTGEPLAQSNAGRLFPSENTQMEDSCNGVRGITAGKVFKIIFGQKGMIISLMYERLKDKMGSDVQSFSDFFRSVREAFVVAGYGNDLHGQDAHLGEYTDESGSRSKSVLMVQPRYLIMNEEPIIQPHPFFLHGCPVEMVDTGVDHPILTVGHEKYPNGLPIILDWDVILTNVLESINKIGYMETMRAIWHHKSFKDFSDVPDVQPRRLPNEFGREVSPFPAQNSQLVALAA